MTDIHVQNVKNPCDAIKIDAKTSVANGVNNHGIRAFDDLYEIREELGRKIFILLNRGRFGIVYRCENRESRESRAAKFIRSITIKDKEQAQLEISIMRSLDHPRLIRILETFNRPRETVLITEYINGGELFERIISHESILTETDCKQYMKQICEGVDYLTVKKVAHLDLKPENILCRSSLSNEIVIIDFGLARDLDVNRPVRVLFGTPEFVAPEVIQYEPITPFTDLWSIGVICYVLLSGLSPFLGDNDAQTFSNVIQGQYDFDDDAFDQVSNEAKEFIALLLIKRPSKRMSAFQCLQHQWLANNSADQLNPLSTEKLRKFYYRRKWQKSGNAIRAIGRLTNHKH